MPPATAQVIEASSTSGVAAGMRESTGAVMLRLMQYETILGDPISSQMALCIDAQRGQEPLQANSATGAPLARTLDGVRRAADLCAISPESGTTRFVGEVREALGQQLARAAAMKAARVCLSHTGPIEQLRDCLTEATGAPPTPAEWSTWKTLYTARSRH